MAWCAEARGESWASLRSSRDSYVVRHQMFPLGWQRTRWRLKMFKRKKNEIALCLSLWSQNLRLEDWKIPRKDCVWKNSKVAFASCVRITISKHNTIIVFCVCWFLSWYLILPGIKKKVMNNCWLIWPVMVAFIIEVHLSLEQVYTY